MLLVCAFLIPFHISVASLVSVLDCKLVGAGTCLFLKLYVKHHVIDHRAGRSLSSWFELGYLSPNCSVVAATKRLEELSVPFTHPPWWLFSTLHRFQDHASLKSSHPFFMPVYSLLSKRALYLKRRGIQLSWINFAWDNPHHANGLKSEWLQKWWGSHCKLRCKIWLLLQIDS